MGTTSKSSERVEHQILKRILRFRRCRPNWKRRACHQPVLHRYEKAVRVFSEMVEGKEFENAFRDSDLSDLAIVTVHNYDEKTIFEQSLDFLGVKDYTVLKHSGEWRHTYRYIHLSEFLEECEKPYILYCDARDTIFTDDPAKVVPLFKEFKCEALFNATMSRKGIFRHCERGGEYAGMMPLLRWTNKMASGRKRYPNSGVFIGRTQFVKEICDVVAFYCERIGCIRFPNNDQDVLRGVYPWFWPRMKLDEYNEIIYRN